MNGGLDESLAPGMCPLCDAKVPRPTSPAEPGGVTRILATHFQTECPALVLASL